LKKGINHRHSQKAPSKNLSNYGATMRGMLWIMRDELCNMEYAIENNRYGISEYAKRKGAGKEWSFRFG